MITAISLALALQVSPQTQQSQLHVDPLLLVQASEVWSVIGRPNNPVWPGWDARKTPILIYFPNKQDVLINHPQPPAGFKPYTGSLKSPIGPIFVKDGTTLFDFDGQNTSQTIGGAGTLVVADTLSNHRQWLQGVVEQSLEQPDKSKEFINQGLFPNPYSSMVMFAHEAFHVYQQKVAPKKSANEIDITQYPSLSVENNVGFALESDFLSQAISSKTPEELRRAGVDWLAVRKWRRALIPTSSAAYEDGNEFSEGLAKYVEYRFMECVQGTKPANEMWLIQGFNGFGHMQNQRDQLVRTMQKIMTGNMLVNNDPFGASPVRFRLYYSGMGVAAMLDRLGAKWHDTMLKTSKSLTQLAEETLKPTPSELKSAIDQLITSERFKSLQTEKLTLARDGDTHIQKVLSSFDQAPGELVIDYSKVANAKVNFTFTSFGVLRISSDQSVFRLIPIRGTIGELGVSEDEARPVLEDRSNMQVRFQLSAVPDEAAIRTQTGQSTTIPKLNLPGVTLTNVTGEVRIEGRKITLLLTHSFRQ